MTRMRITRRDVMRALTCGAGFGALACIPIVIFRPGVTGVYMIAAVACVIGGWVFTALDSLDKPDRELSPLGIRSRDRWRRFLARLGRAA